MITNAKNWATARGLTRTNEVHGAEEYKVPTAESFLFRNSDSQSTKTKGFLQVEDRCTDMHIPYVYACTSSLTPPAIIDRSNIIS